MLDFHGLPKAELHLHLEGSIEPETVLELDPSLTIDYVESKYRHSNFAEFIQSYIWVNRLLRGPSEYALITRRLLERLEAENVTYAEINLSAGMILWKGQDLPACFKAAAAEATRSNIQVRWIFDAVRQFGADHARTVAEAAVTLKDPRIVGFGIGGDEAGGPAGIFREVFAYAGGHGLAILPHAGETCGPESVRAAIEAGADRVGHGIRAAEDPDLLKFLAAEQIPLEVCISSNVYTGVVKSLDAHPVRRLFDAGVPVTLNTDDPALFHTTLSREFEIASTLGFSESELELIRTNAFRFARAYEPEL